MSSHETNEKKKKNKNIGEFGRVIFFNGIKIVRAVYIMIEVK